jgi:mannose-6-phosphate isomerase
MVVFEVQEYSDLTYRVYDYGRVDSNGKPRELHIEKALDVMDFDSSSGGKVSPANWIKGRENTGLTHLVDCPYFSVDRFELESSIHFRNVKTGPSHFQIMVVLSGNGILSWIPARGTTGAFEFRQGECWFIPADTFKGFSYGPDGKATLIIANVPDRAHSPSIK